MAHACPARGGPLTNGNEHGLGARRRAESEGRVQTPSTGLGHPSLPESAGKGCSECGLGAQLTLSQPVSLNGLFVMSYNNNNNT